MKLSTRFTKLIKLLYHLFLKKIVYYFKHNPFNIYILFKEMPLFQDRMAATSASNKAASSNHPSASLGSSSNSRGVGVSNLKQIYSGRGFLSQVAWSDDALVVAHPTAALSLFHALHSYESAIH